MKKTLIYLLFTFLMTSIWSQPRPVKFSNTVIIDTDCGIDDMRAISLLLAQHDITIKTILTSDGSLSPEEGGVKVLSLLNEFNRSDIPVAPGSAVAGINPAWRQFNSSIRWGSGTGGQIMKNSAADQLLKILTGVNEKITLVCLGPLTNIAKAAGKDANMFSKIERIVWYNESVKPLQGFNFECDKESAGSIFKSGVRIDVISNLNTGDALFDTSLVASCSRSKTRLARVLYYVFSQAQVVEKLKENHFKLYDDLVALYLTDPELFSINTDMDRLNVRFNKEYDILGVKEAYKDMVSGTYVNERNIVFNRFPVQPEMFNYDIRPVMDSAIARYGSEEWKANVMTDEFHGHLGVFSIVGAKMGIRARELFGVGPDMLEVISYAGNEPPYSCLNDGIQVSTGATLGMGTIRVASGRKASPSAVFTYDSRSVRITLKPEYLAQVDADIREGIQKFGLMDDGYWKHIRRNALKYWVEWDRDKIFDIEEMNRKK